MQEQRTFRTARDPGLRAIQRRIERDRAIQVRDCLRSWQEVPSEKLPIYSNDPTEIEYAQAEVKVEGHSASYRWAKQEKPFNG